MRGVLVASLLLIATPAANTVRVSVKGGKVDVDANRAPLAAILGALAEKTGMAVVYEGRVPRPFLTLSLHDRTPAEAVLEVLEGQGLTYAASLDPSGTRVAKLLILGRGSSPAQTAGVSGRAALPVPREPPEVEPEPSPVPPQEAPPTSLPALPAAIPRSAFPMPTPLSLPTPTPTPSGATPGTQPAQPPATLPRS